MFGAPAAPARRGGRSEARREALTRRTDPAAEIVLMDGLLAVFRKGLDVSVMVIGAEKEVGGCVAAAASRAASSPRPRPTQNEIMLANVLEGFYNATSTILRSVRGRNAARGRVGGR